MIRNCILFGHTRRVSSVDAVGKVLEEVVPEDAGDTPEQMNVNIFFFEYFIDVGTCTAQLGSEPSHCAPLLVKRAFDKLSRMNHVCPCYIRPFDFP